MRIAISSPIRWATGLAAIVTAGLLGGMLAARPAPPSSADHSAKLARAELAKIERELDTLSENLETGLAALDDSESSADRGVARDSMVKLVADIKIIQQVDFARARQLRATLAR